jgi:hypothetical protein
MFRKLSVNNFGVYASDCLPIKVGPSTAFIVNTNPHTKSGTHWIAIYLDRSGRLEYFDSFGQPPTVTDHVRFIRRKCFHYYWNSSVLQSAYSAVCGHYWLTYLYFRTKGYSLQDYISLFTTDVNRNDSVVYELYRYYLKDEH